VVAGNNITTPELFEHRECQRDGCGDQRHGAGEHELRVGDGGGTLAAGVVTWNIGGLAASAPGRCQLVVAVTSPLANGTVITTDLHDRLERDDADARAAITTTVNWHPC